MLYASPVMVATDTEFDDVVERKIFLFSVPSFSRLAYSDKKMGIHSRIIWACSWSHDDKYFITVSRDKKVSIFYSGSVK
jgi:hypothetical protein